MYIPKETLATTVSLYTNEFYTIIQNPKLEAFADADDEVEGHRPNYFVVNLKTGAIEYAADQLAAVADVSDKLRDAWNMRVGAKVPQDQLTLN